MSTIITEIIDASTPPLRDSLLVIDAAGVLIARDEEDGEGLFLTVPAQTMNPSGLVTSTPATPYTFTVQLQVHAPSYNASPIGIMARESASGGKLKTYGVQNASLVASKYATGPAINSFYGARSILMGSELWLQWADDGTNVAMRSSQYGRHWREDFSVARTDWCTPNQIGVCVSANQDDSATALLVRGWALG